MKKFTLTFLLLLSWFIGRAQCASGTFGNYPPPFTTPASFGANYLLGTNHTLTASSMLIGLGYRGNGTGATMRMAIYTNTNIAGSDSPDNLVAYTNTTTVGTGNFTIAVITPTMIPAGIYWIMADYNGGTGTNHVNNTTAVGTKTVYYISLPVTSPPPQTSTAWLNYTYRDFDYWGVILSSTVNVSVTPSSTLVCSGSPVVLTAGGSSTYTWNTNAVTNTILVTPSVSTNYTVSSDLGTCTAVAVASVAVSPGPTINVSSGGVCPGGTFTIQPSGAGTYTIAGGSATVSPLTTTSYSIIGTSTLGCAGSNTAVCTVSVYAPPVVTVNSGSICSGNAFLISPSGASTYTYSGGSALVSPTVTTSYNVTGTSAQGCVSSNTAVSTVSVEISPTISVNSGTLCSGSVFTMVPSGAFTYTFSNGSNTVAPTSNANYFVNGSSAAGCVAAAQAICNVTVHALPVITVNNGTVCSGSAFTIVPSGASTYTFSGGSAVVNPTSTSVYSVTGTSSLGCTGTSPALSTVTTLSLPAVTAASNKTTICAGSSCTLSASGATSYTWSTSAGTRSIIVSPSITTVYTVTGTGTNGCTQSFTLSQVVSDCSGFGSSLTASGSRISVYPNPSNGEFIIASESPAELTLINELGQILLKLSMNAVNEHQIKVKDLPNGVYFISGTNENQVIRQKIIVSR